jgi:hypothetical protein
MRSNFKAWAVAALALGMAGSALAAPSICVQLEAQLVDASGGNAGAQTNYRQFDEAANRQRAELDRAKQEAARLGCQSGFAFFRPQSRDPRCEAALAQVERMQANYDRLRQQRDQYAPSSSASGERALILRALADNNCGPQYAAYRSGFSSFFSGWNDRRWNDSNYGGNGADFGATYRTLCVRTCDGYYFPISFSTVRSKFGSDQQACQAMCPNTDVQLYVHRNPGEESEAMVSASSGQPYSRLPTAFAYRKSFDAACTCQSGASAGRVTPLPGAVGGNRAPGTASGAAPAAAARVLPLPARKPNVAEDPDTLANAAADFRPPVATATATASDAPKAFDSNGHEVRVVGPSYYYAQ